jgi:hypothetical protein
MSQPEKTTHDLQQETGDRRQESASLSRILPGLLIVGMMLAISCLSGCGKQPGSRNGDKDVKIAKEQPWKVAGKRLHDHADLATCKAVIGKLNTDLVADREAPQPTAMTPEAEAALAALVPLNDDDRAEIRSATFTSFDPNYVGECLYLRDAARSLEVPGLKPEEAADLGFAWVCRQVYLNPWLIPVPGRPGLLEASALPPSFVLRRGHGSGLERMYVFLALLQQMGLDGCLVGPPDAGSLHSGFIALAPDKKTVLTETPRGPFWAVGVRIGNDIRLYDPWRGRAFPATLNQLKANPDAQKAWFADSANVSGVTPEDLKTATTYLSIPVNSLSPRMAMTEDQLKADLGVKLAFDPAALRAAFPDPKPAFWNPPKDRFAYGRTARMFLPVEEGGADRTELGPNRLYESYFRDQLPVPQRVLPDDFLKALNEAGGRDEQRRLENEAFLQDVRERIVTFARGTYGTAFLLISPTPRERLQRGQFQDASRDLVERQDGFGLALTRIRNTRDSEQQIKDWARKGVELLTARGFAQLSKDPLQIEAADTAYAEHWQKQVGASLLFDRAIAEVGLAEATMLLALCKHEQAERAQAMFEHAAGPDVATRRQDAIDAWTIALAEWRTYARQTDSRAAFPAHAGYVAALTARAEKLASQK